MREITKSDLENIIGSSICGFRIEKARIKSNDSDCYGIALGKNDRNVYVTWQFHWQKQMRRILMTVEAYIHSLKDRVSDRNVLGKAEILKSIGDNLYLAEYNGIRCTAIFNFFDGRYYVDDVYGIVTSIVTEK